MIGTYLVLRFESSADQSAISLIWSGFVKNSNLHSILFDMPIVCALIVTDPIMFWNRHLKCECPALLCSYRAIKGAEMVLLAEIFAWFVCNKS
jgi:hypothetical protein